MESKHEIPDITRKPFECDSDYEARLIRSFHSLEAALKEKELERFAPLGDNHHNAAMCPHCNPRLVEMTRQLAEARSQIEALTKDRDFAQGRATAHAITIGRLEAQLADCGKPVTAMEWSSAHMKVGHNGIDITNEVIRRRTQSRQGAPMSERSAGE